MIRPALLFVLCAIIAPIGGDGVDMEEDLILEWGGWPTNGLLLSKKFGGPREPGGGM